MTPREPDRFEEKAKELCLTEWRPIAAALRQAADEALERAARGCAEKGRDYERRAAGQYEHGSADEAGYLAQRASAWRDAESLCRALASPAAPPTAERARCQCIIGAVAASCVYATPGRPCECACHAPPSSPAPLLPRVLAALEWEATLHAIGRARHVVLTDLAAELRAYIAEREPAEKRIAELERLANDNAFSGMQHKARADAAEKRVAELETRR